MPWPEQLSMTNMKLYFAPGTCARAPLIALEEIGVEFETQLVVYMRGENKSAEYLALNPNGKIPTLVVDGKALTETTSILLYLANAYPDAKLLPLGRGELEDALVITDLVWCSANLHPNVFRIRLPQFFCDTEEGLNRVREIAIESMKPNFARIEKRLGRAPWILGQEWSIIDAYLFWVWFRLDGTEFDLRPYPCFADHIMRIKQRPSVQRALAREQEAFDWLEENDLMVNFATFDRHVQAVKPAN